MVTNTNAVELFDDVLAEQSEGIMASVSYTADMYATDYTLDNLSVRNGDALHGVLMSQGELTLGWFDAVRVTWCDGYRGIKVGSSDEAVRKAWSRAWKCVTDYYNIEKPSATTSGAEAKAEQRAKQDELLAAYIDVPVRDIQAEIKSLFNKAGDLGDTAESKAKAKEAKLQADKLVKVVDAKQKSEVKEAKDAVKNIKADITALLKLVTDLDVLSDIKVMLEGSVEDSEAMM